MPPPQPSTSPSGWRSSAARLLALAIGDPHQFPLDHRLFNSVSLLNTITNIGGLPSLWPLQNAGVLIALNLGTGLIFLGFYAVARFRGLYRPLYWPFVLTIAVFLFANMLFNAGSAGGAVWYLVPALIIATALEPAPGMPCWLPFCLAVLRWEFCWWNNAGPAGSARTDPPPNVWPM